MSLVLCDLLACRPFHKNFEVRLGEWVPQGQESTLWIVFRWRTASVYGPAPTTFSRPRAQSRPWSLDPGPGLTRFPRPRVLRADSPRTWLARHFCNVVVGLCFAFDGLLCFGCPNTGEYRGFSLVLAFQLVTGALESPFSALFKLSQSHTWPAQAPDPPFVSYNQSMGSICRLRLEGEAGCRFQRVEWNQSPVLTALEQVREHPLPVPCMKGVQGSYWATFLPKWILQTRQIPF